MIFRLGLLFILSVFFLAGCSEEKLHSHAIKTEDDLDNLESSQPKPSKQSSSDFFSEEYLLLDQKIKATPFDDNDLSIVLRTVSANIFGAALNDSSTYESLPYLGYIQLYSQLFGIYKQKLNLQLFNKNFIKSAQVFRKTFLDICISGKREGCRYLEVILKKESSLSLLINELAIREDNLLLRLELLALAQEVSGDSRFSILKINYIQTLARLLTSKNMSPQFVQAHGLREHLLAGLDILSEQKFKQPSAENIKIFTDLEVWKIDGNSGSWLDAYRHQLITYLPLYSKASLLVKARSHQEAKHWLEGLLKDSFDLSSYPAFVNSDLNNLGSEDSLLEYAIIGLVRGRLGARAATEFLNNLSLDLSVQKKVFPMVTRMVRWFIAQKTIKSSQQLSQKLNEFATVDRENVVKLINYSKVNVNGQWDHLFSRILPVFKSFLIKNVSLSHGNFTHEDISDFFKSIPRNIYKVSVYPNMMAIMFKMLSNDWKDGFDRGEMKRFYKSSAEMLDVFMSGNTMNPWFGFSQIPDKVYDSETKKLQRSLLRFEVVDSFYYFFATKTHEQYQINGDEFLYQIFKRLMQIRMPTLELFLAMQRRTYFGGSETPITKFIKWCHGIKTKNYVPETLDFYTLSRQLTPLLSPLSQVNANKKPSLYFYDSIKENDGYTSVYTHSVLEIFRQDYLPVAKTLRQITDLAGQFLTSSSGGSRFLTGKTQTYLQNIESFQKVFLGAQISIIEKLGDCNFQAAKESQRRSQQITFYENTYLTQFIHPLLKLVSEGRLSLRRANDNIARANNFHPAVEARIYQAGDGQVIYVHSLQGFIYRAALYLKEGFFIDPSTFGRGLLSDSMPVVDLPPIVGETLTLDVPTDLRVARNKYIQPESGLSKSYDFVYSKKISAQQASRGLIFQFTDSMLSGGTDNSRETKWASVERAALLSDNKEQVESLVQMYQMGSLEYVDFLNPDCEVYFQDRFSNIDSDCLTKNKVSFDPLTQTLRNMFASLHLDEQSLRYFELIDYRGYAENYSLRVQLKPDPTIKKNNSHGVLPYKHISGYFDTVYDMFDADYLGSSYKTLSETEFSDARSEGCARVHSNCLWLTERELARELYYSRVDKPGLIFSFDKSILDTQYEYIKGLVSKKYQALKDIENEGDTFLDKNLRPQDRVIKVARSHTPQEVFPLSKEFKNYDYRHRRFFKDETDSFYLKKPDWAKYLRFTKDNIEP